MTNPDQTHLVNTFLALLTLICLAAAGLTVFLAVVLALAIPPRRAAVVSFAVTGAALAFVWIVLSYRGGVRADETGTGGNILEDVIWLIAADVAGITSLILGSRYRRQHFPLAP